MIWFACKQCGKVHGRPETSTGSMVFCPCGEGMLVPWESTAAEPPESAAPPPLPPARPTPVLEPVAFPNEPPPQPRERSRGRRVEGPADPNFCFNHTDVPLHATCSDCAEPFCRDCLVVFQGVTLCGPCKNHRIRALQTPSRTSGWAVASLIVALASCFFVCIVPVAGAVGGLLVLATQLAAFGLGLAGVRQSEVKAKTSGQWLALTGMVTAVVFGLITLVLLFMAPHLQRLG